VCCSATGCHGVSAVPSTDGLGLVVLPVTDLLVQVEMTTR
jgi:hypothetical protein